MIYRLNKYKIVVLYDLKSLSLKVPLEVIKMILGRIGKH